MPRDITGLTVRPSDTLRDVLNGLERCRLGITLVVDSQQILLATLTDGDMRRGILRGTNLDQSVGDFLLSPVKVSKGTPVTVTAGVTNDQARRVLQSTKLRHLPVVDVEGRVVDLIMIDDLLPAPAAGLRAMIMAGGAGRRLMPLTEETPKPMLPIGERPLLALTIDRLRSSGISHIHIATHHHSKKISQYFGDGAGFGVNLSYLDEEHPLGTAGALAGVSGGDGPVLVINGDILTNVDFKSMSDFHQEHEADLTVAVCRYDMEVAYGIVECNGEQVKSISEKPRLNFLVNAGIYIVETAVLSALPAGRPFDMPDLITRLIDERRAVISFPVMEYWLDIGRPADYQQAQDDIRSGKLSVGLARA